MSRQAAATSDSSAVVVPDPRQPSKREVAVGRAPAEGGAPLLGRHVDDTDGIGGWSPSRAGSGGSHGRCGGATSQSAAALRIDAHEHGQLGVGAIARRTGASTTRSPSSPRRVTGPVLRADWNTTVSPGPSRSIVRPGVRTRERRRLVVTDDVTGVGNVLQPQREAQVGVGADVVADDAGRALRGQHEVDAEAATALGDADERREERRQLGGQGGELVDHDDEARQRGAAGHGRGTRRGRPRRRRAAVAPGGGSRRRG